MITINIDENNEITVSRENDIKIVFHVVSISWFDLVEAGLKDDEVKKVWSVVNSILMS
jgi:hypothetical protein